MFYQIFLFVVVWLQQLNVGLIVNPSKSLLNQSKNSAKFCETKPIENPRKAKGNSYGTYATKCP